MREGDGSRPTLASCGTLFSSLYNRTVVYMVKTSLSELQSQDKIAEIVLKTTLDWSKLLWFGTDSAVFLMERTLSPSTWC